MGHLNLFSYFCTQIRCKNMNTNKPLLLISNDDGYHAKGINSLIDMLSDLADIVVCAPESARSGFACAFTVNDPLRLKLRREREGMKMWS